MAGPRNPLERTRDSSPQPATVSTTTYTITGIQCSVYGLAELPGDLAELAELSCLWLLHPRLGDQSSMADIAALAIDHWNRRLRQRAGAVAATKQKGLIAVSFDQRNHGARVVDARANEAWRDGNRTHAQDMFGIYQGTARDTSLLLRHIGAYLPPHLSAPPLSHHVLGISLGAHSAWQLVAADRAVRTAVALIGCPDYARLMVHRAEKSKLPSFFAPQDDNDDAAARAFLASPDFPPALRAELPASDPAAMLLPDYLRAPGPGTGSVKVQDREGCRRKLDEALGGKAVFALSGAADKLVPYAAGEAFYRFLRAAVGGGVSGGEVEEGWWADGDCVFVERVYEGVGHEVTPEMALDAVRFLADVVLDGKKGAAGMASRL